MWAAMKYFWGWVGSILLGPNHVLARADRETFIDGQAVPTGLEDPRVSHPLVLDRKGLLSFFSGAMAVAEKVREAVENFHFHSKGERVVITLSAGVAKLAEGEKIADTFSRADKALYEAKNSGRNRCVDGG